MWLGSRPAPPDVCGGDAFMTLRRILWPALVLLVFQFAVSAAYAGTGYHLIKTIKASDSQDTWDFQTIDEIGRRLYASHFSEVIVVDIDSGDVVRKIPTADGVHGVAVAREFGRGFISVGHTNSVTVF